MYLLIYCLIVHLQVFASRLEAKFSTEVLDGERYWGLIRRSVAIASDEMNLTAGSTERFLRLCLRTVDRAGHMAYKRVVVMKSGKSQWPCHFLKTTSGILKSLSPNRFFNSLIESHAKAKMARFVSQDLQ